ncbi:hypothetical protein REPUB_Repub03eG0256500 [Reevesia pubescens]
MIKKKNGEIEQNPDDNQRNTAKEQLSFPDEILFRITTFLPFESAVQTTFLSTRWKDLWKKALVLNGTIEDAVFTILSLLDDFSELHPPRKKWGLQFNFGQGRVLFASIAPNNTLHLDFSAGEQEFPKSFDWLLPLNPPSRETYNHENILELNPPLPTDQLFIIKALYLISVCRLSSKALTSMVSNLPFLESLTITKCNGVQSLDIEYAAKLQKLIVFDCQQLEYFCFGEDAMLDFRQGPLTQWTWDIEKPCPYRPYYGFYESNHCGCASKFECLKSILKSIDGVKSLTLCRWFFEETMCKKLPFSSIFLNKLKELWWIDRSMRRENINALLCFLKFCPNLERLYVTIDPKCYDLPSTEKFSAIVSAPDKLNHLKVVKLEGCADEKNEMLLARRLIPLFPESPLIISKPDGTCWRHLVKVPKLEKKGKYPYKFKVVENLHEICPHHLHMNL